VLKVGYKATEGFQLQVKSSFLSQHALNLNEKSSSLKNIQGYRLQVHLSDYCLVPYDPFVQEQPPPCAIESSLSLPRPQLGKTCIRLFRRVLNLREVGDAMEQPSGLFPLEHTRGVLGVLHALDLEEVQCIKRRLQSLHKVDFTDHLVKNLPFKYQGTVVRGPDS
jgi:hypothetical protein